MKLDKIYLDIANAHYRKKFGNGAGKLVIGEWDETQYIVTYDAVSVYVVPKKHFPFDIRHVFDGLNQNFKRVLEPPRGVKPVPATLTPECRRVPMSASGKKAIMARRLTNGEIDVWVDEARLKPFAKDATFTITTPHSFIGVYENNQLVGITLPMKMPKEGEQ